MCIFGALTEVLSIPKVWQQVNRMTALLGVFTHVNTNQYKTTLPIKKSNPQIILKLFVLFVLYMVDSPYTFLSRYDPMEGVRTGGL